MQQSGMTDEGRPLEGTLVLLIEEDFFLANYVGAVLTSAGAQVLGPARTVSEAETMVRSLSGMPLAAVISANLLHAEDGAAEAVLDRLGTPLLILQQDCRGPHLSAQRYDVLTAPFGAYQIVDHLSGIHQRASTDGTPVPAPRLCDREQ